MKTLANIFIASFCILFMTSLKIDTANTAEYSQVDKADYAELTEIIFKQSAESEFRCTSSKKRIVIMNLEGKSIREDCVENENIFSSLMLTPLIQRSDLVMEIDNVYYYLLDSN